MNLLHNGCEHSFGGAYWYGGGGPSPVYVQQCIRCGIFQPASTEAIVVRSTRLWWKSLSGRRKALVVLEVYLSLWLCGAVVATALAFIGAL